MATFKIVIGNKDGRSVQKEISEDQSSAMLGKKIGDKFSGDEMGLSGYEFQITGGSDNSGSPMRSDAAGIGKKKILCVSGIGVRKLERGQKQRKTVCGNTISETTAQVNIKILKQGKEELFAKKEEASKETDAGAKAEEHKGKTHKQ